jgi:hypothetical protein
LGVFSSRARPGASVDDEVWLASLVALVVAHDALVAGVLQLTQTRRDAYERIPAASVMAHGGVQFQLISHRRMKVPPVLADCREHLLADPVLEDFGGLEAAPQDE